LFSDGWSDDRRTAAWRGDPAAFTGPVCGLFRPAKRRRAAARLL